MSSLFTHHKGKTLRDKAKYERKERLDKLESANSWHLGNKVFSLDFSHSSQHTQHFGERKKVPWDIRFGSSLHNHGLCSKNKKQFTN